MGHFHQRPTRWITDLLGDGFLLSRQRWPLLLLAGHSTVVEARLLIPCITSIRATKAALYRSPSTK